MERGGCARELLQWSSVSLACQRHCQSSVKLGSLPRDGWCLGLGRRDWATILRRGLLLAFAKAEQRLALQVAQQPAAVPAGDACPLQEAAATQADGRVPALHLRSAAAYAVLRAAGQTAVNCVTMVALHWRHL